MTSTPTREELAELIAPAWYWGPKAYTRPAEHKVIAAVVELLLPLLVERDTEISALKHDRLMQTTASEIVFEVLLRERDEARAEIERLKLQAVTLDGQALDAFDRGAQECDRLLGILRERHGTEVSMSSHSIFTGLPNEYTVAYVTVGGLGGASGEAPTLLLALRAAVGDET